MEILQLLCSRRFPLDNNTPQPNCKLNSKSKSHCYWRSVSQSESLGVEPHLGLMTRYLLPFGSYGLVFVVRPLWREDGSVFFICCWPSPAQFFSGAGPLGLVAIFYCLRFETSFFVASYDSQGHGGGIRPRLHTDSQLNSLLQQSSLYLGTYHIESTVPLLLRAYSLRGNVFAEPLPRNGRCLFALSRGLCIATAVHAAVL
jgi:hypothetical protein